MGLHAGAVGAAAQAPVCQGGEYIVLEGRDARFFYHPENGVIVSNDDNEQYVQQVNLPYYVTGPDVAWHRVGSYNHLSATQCMGGVRIMFLHAGH